MEEKNSADSYGETEFASHGEPKITAHFGIRTFILGPNKKNF